MFALEYRRVTKKVGQQESYISVGLYRDMERALLRGFNTEIDYN
jgi:hypothetical protein